MQSSYIAITFLSVLNQRRGNPYGTSYSILRLPIATKSPPAYRYAPGADSPKHVTHKIFRSRLAKELFEHSVRIGKANPDDKPLEKSNAHLSAAEHGKIDMLPYWQRNCAVCVKKKEAWDYLMYEKEGIRRASTRNSAGAT